MKQQNHTAPEVEAWCIGALLDADGPVLRSNAPALLDSSGLTAEDFTTQPATAYFGAIRALAEKGRPTHPETVFVAGRGLPGFQEGSLGHLEQLRGANQANRATFAAHAEELRRLTRLRKLEAFHASQLQALSAPRCDPTKLATAVEAFSQSFSSDIAPDETGDRDMFELMEDWDAYMQGIRTPYVPSGIQVLDEHLGGWVCNLNVVGGLPSVGKSALVAEAIRNALRSGTRVGVFGLEDATKWISKRLLARAMSIPVGKIAATRLSEHQQEALQEEAGKIANLTRNMLVYRRAGITPEELLQRCKHWVLNKGVQVIFIDHGGEVRHASQAARDRHDLAVANTYRGLRDLAVNHRVPVVVLCHFNRGTEDKGKPTPQSFAETAYIERMARVAVGLWEQPHRPGQLLCTLLKVTEGKRGETLWLQRDESSALVSSSGGGVVDFAAEEAEHKARTEESKRSKPTWRTA